MNGALNGVMGINSELTCVRSCKLCCSFKAVCERSEVTSPVADFEDQPGQRQARTCMVRDLILPL